MCYNKQGNLYGEMPMKTLICLLCAATRHNLLLPNEANNNSNRCL